MDIYLPQINKGMRKIGKGDIRVNKAAKYAIFYLSGALGNALWGTATKLGAFFAFDPIFNATWNFVKDNTNTLTLIEKIIWGLFSFLFSCMIIVYAVIFITIYTIAVNIFYVMSFKKRFFADLKVPLFVYFLYCMMAAMCFIIL